MDKLHLAHEESLQRPGWADTIAELNVPLHLYRTLRGSSELFGLPDGDGRPVLLLPGFGTGDSTLLPLRYFLRNLGYQAKCWGLGVNKGHVEEDTQRTLDRLADWSDQLSHEPITLIGWSLGGAIAREAARLRPDLVHGVITLGTPVFGGPKYTLVADYYARQFGIDLDELEEDIRARNLEGLKVPVTSIFSKTDGVVGWQASIDTFNPQARNVCVRSSHATLGISPEVFASIAKALAHQ